MLGRQVLLILYLSTVLCSSQVETVSSSCTSYKFSNGLGRHYRSCKNLPVLNAFLHWNYKESSNVIEVAFRMSDVSDRRWIAWAINPTSIGMVGSQAFVAFQRTDGSIAAYTAPITSYGTQLQEGSLSFPVFNVSAVHKHSEMIIFASLQLPTNSSIVNHAWQDGPLSENSPLTHTIDPSSPNVKAFRQLDFLSGNSTQPSTKRWNLKYVHALLNVAGWGVLMSVGTAVASCSSNLQPDSSSGLNLQSVCQGSAYLFGVAGFATGMILGSEAPGIQHNIHRYLGIAILSLATTHILVAAIARPKRDANSIRCFGHLHLFMGNILVFMSICNILLGLHMLQAPTKWIIICSAITVPWSWVGPILTFIKMLQYCRR